jgi:thiol-disulfide isomerase/thioredoxin
MLLVFQTSGTPVSQLRAQGPAVQVEATGEIFGKIIDADGAPVAGAQIKLHRFHLSPIGQWSWWVSASQPVFTDKGGAYRFPKLRGAYCLQVTHAGYARSFRRTRVKANQHNQTDIVLKRPVRLTIQLTDVAGRPVAGARVREFAERGVNGQCDMTQLDLKSLGVEFPASDAKGRLELAWLPDGDFVRLAIEHPRLAPVRIEELAVTAGRVIKATMPPAVMLTFRVPTDKADERITSAFVDLRHERYTHPSTTNDYEIPFAAAGVARLAVAPGDYPYLVLQHEDFYLTPTYFSKLRLKPGQNVDLQFHLHRRVPARGRIIDADTGRPIANASVAGEIATGAAMPTSAAMGAAGPPAEKWSFAEYARTNADGRYEIRLAPGKARVSYLPRGGLIAEDEYREFNVAADGSTVIPDIWVRRLPKVAGVVQNPDGSAAARAVVRLRGPDVLEVQPVLTDENGRFEIQPDEVPVDEKTEAREFAQHVVAFDPYRPLAARCEVRLDKPAKIVLKLEPHDADWPVSAFADELRPWERGIVPREESRRMAAISLRGQLAPELDGALWINTDGKPLRLASLRGKYVLLDFWFTGCGPCHHEFPSVKLVHELYRDHGVVVIGVHTNSSPPRAVREHVAELGLPFPVMVDQADSRTVAPYESHGCASSFPAYLLLGPDGKVLLDDRTIPHPRLRSYKLEIIRQYLLAGRRQEKG